MGIESQAHKVSLVNELRARLTREKALARVQRDAEVQKILMSSKGARKEIVGKRSGKTAEEERGIVDEDPAANKGSQAIKLPQPEVGVRTGARVWVRSLLLAVVLRGLAYLRLSSRNGRASGGDKMPAKPFASMGIRC